MLYNLNPITMVYIYILRLQKGKYYIGKTSNPIFRLENHINNKGSEWTKLYKPLELLELIPDCDDYDEDKYTKIYMDKYGIDNVRGGSYTGIELSTNTIKQLIKSSNSANNRCFTCGKFGHFSNNCYKNMLWCCEFCDKEFTDKNKCINHEQYCKKKFKNTVCYRCGRDGHYISSCYATRHIKGYYLN